MSDDLDDLMEEKEETQNVKPSSGKKKISSEEFKRLHDEARKSDFESKKAVEDASFESLIKELALLKKEVCLLIEKNEALLSEKKLAPKEESQVQADPYKNIPYERIPEILKSVADASKSQRVEKLLDRYKSNLSEFEQKLGSDELYSQLVSFLEEKIEGKLVAAARALKN